MLIPVVLSIIPLPIAHHLQLKGGIRRSSLLTTGS
jgi:hypothetical protein